MKRWIIRQWDKLASLPQEVVWFYQRGRRGWADCDSWSIDTYIAPIFVEMLERQIQTGITVFSNTGVPKAIQRTMLLHIKMTDGMQILTHLEQRQYECGWHLLRRNFGRLWD